MKFLAVLGLVAAMTLTGYLGVLSWGQKREFSNFENAFTQQPKPWIFVPWFQDSLPKRDQPGSVIPMLTLVRDAEGVLRIVPPGSKESKNSPALEDEKIKDFPFLALKIESYKENIQEQVAAAFDDKWDDRILVLSEYDNVIEQLKKLKPRWLYSASQPDLLRWKFYSALGLLSALVFERDVLSFSPVPGREDLTAEFLTETHRRHRFFLLQLDRGPAAAALEQMHNDQKIDGVLVQSNDQVQ
jgi:hypothetical protein